METATRTAWFRFYEELNDFLPRDRRKRDLEVGFPGRRSVKDLIESMGVPHVEVDLILVNGEPVNFGHILSDGDRVSVYPVFERLDIGGVTRLRPSPLREPRFVLDVHLRKLARKMRLLGFDVDYAERRDDPELASIAERENRILLTRDRRLLMRKNVSRGLIVRNTDPAEQVMEILRRLDLGPKIRPFTRCIACNGEVGRLLPGSASFEEARGLIPPGVLSWCGEYYRCGGCGKVYWKGSHYERLMEQVKRITKMAEDSGRDS